MRENLGGKRQTAKQQADLDCERQISRWWYIDGERLTDYLAEIYRWQETDR